MKKEDYLTFIEKGKKFIYKGDYNSAIEIFNEGLNNSKNPIFYLYLGICYFRCNDYLTAKTQLKIYENIGKEDLEICYLFLSAVFKEMQDFEKCYYYYQKFLGKDTKSINTRTSTGFINSYNNIINTKVENVYKLFLSIN